MHSVPLRQLCQDIIFSDKFASYLYNVCDYYYEWRIQRIISKVMHNWVLRLPFEASPRFLTNKLDSTVYLEMPKDKLRRYAQDKSLVILWRTWFRQKGAKWHCSSTMTNWLPDTSTLACSLNGCASLLPKWWID